LWVIAVLASLAVVIIFVLCVPLDVILHFDVYGRPKFRMRLAWLFGLVSKEIKQGEKKPEQEVAVERKRKPGPKIGDIFRVLRTKGLVGKVISLVRNIFSRLKIRDLIANFKIGLDNPADTGLLFAVISPTTLFLSPPSPCQIKLRPSFADEAVIEGCLYSIVRVHPIQFVIPVAGFVFSLPALRAVKTLVLMKWKTGK